MHRDAWYETIFEPADNDAETATILGGIATGLVKYLRAAVADHLEGGIYENLQATEVVGVPNNNKLCERKFSLPPPLTPTKDRKEKKRRKN